MYRAVSCSKRVLFMHILGQVCCWSYLESRGIFVISGSLDMEHTFPLIVLLVELLICNFHYVLYGFRLILEVKYLEVSSLYLRMLSLERVDFRRNSRAFELLLGCVMQPMMWCPYSLGVIPRAFFVFSTYFFLNFLHSTALLLFAGAIHSPKNNTLVMFLLLC